MEDITATLKVVMMASGLAVGIFLVVALGAYLVSLALNWRRDRNSVQFVKHHGVSSDW